MIGLVQKRKKDGTFHNIGTEGQTITKSYKSRETLYRYGVPETWKKDGVRIELYHNDNIYCDPFEVLEIHRKW